MMTDATLFWIVALVASFCVGAGKGGLPMVAILSVPILSLVMSPMQGAALLLPVYLISDIYGIWLYSGSFSRRNLAILIPDGALGVFAGWFLAGDTYENVVRVIIGCVGLTFLTMRQRQRFLGGTTPKPADFPRGIIWGQRVRVYQFRILRGRPSVPALRLATTAPQIGVCWNIDHSFCDYKLDESPTLLHAGFDRLGRYAHHDDPIVHRNLRCMGWL
jgi:uncharacterized membrane protein YfcA